MENTENASPATPYEAAPAFPATDAALPGNPAGTPSGETPSPAFPAFTSDALGQPGMAIPSAAIPVDPGAGSPPPAPSAWKTAETLLPWMILAAVLFVLWRKSRKFAAVVSVAANPDGEHIDTLKKDISVATGLSEKAVEALWNSIDHDTPLDPRVVDGIAQIDVVYRKTAAGKAERILEIAACGASAKQIRRDTRTYDYDFLPKDVRAAFIRTGKNEVAKLLYRKA